MPHIKLPTHQSVRLRNASFTIGSDPACDLPLKGQNIFPRHLILQSRGERWQAATLALRAPVFINDHPLTSLTLLNDGDRIRVGDVTFVWQEQNAPGVQPSPWKGLLLIFLAVMTMMSAVFAWFSVNGGDQIVPEITRPAPPAIVITTPAVIKSGPQPVFEGLSEAGHPIYRITLPPSSP
jgi:hypothetical protein